MAKALRKALLNLKDKTQQHSVVELYMSHKHSVFWNVERGRFQEALESTQPQATCGQSCLPELQEYLQLELLHFMLNTDGPEYVTRSDVKDVFSRLMALESLQSNQSESIDGIFDSIVMAYYPNNVKIFFDTLHIHEDTHRQKLLKNVHSAMERRLYRLLQSMGSSVLKEKLREQQKTNFSDLIQAMAIPLHDDTVPAMLYPPTFLHQYFKYDHYCPLFMTAVKLNLAPQALLLYDAGAVGNKELRLLAEDPDVQNMLKNEEDKSVLAVFLWKVLHKPRSLESLATMQVSRLLGLCEPGDKEQTARGLGLLDYHVERILLRHQCGRYRAALKQADKQADDEDKAGASQ